MGTITEDAESDAEGGSSGHLSPSSSFAASGRQAPSKPQAQRTFHDELALAGYLLARDVVGDPVNDGLERLRTANDSVNQTRKMLWRGRGNVRSDVKATDHESSARTRLAQELTFELSGKDKIDFSDAHHLAGAARFMEAGACSEHANVAIHLHAEKLQESGDTVHFAYRPLVDHAWSEVRSDNKKNATIVMDPWDEGPAVYSQDARHTHNRTGIRSAGQYNNVTGPGGAVRAEAVAEHLAQTKSPKDIAADIAERKEPIPKRMLLDAKGVVSQDFARRAAKKLSQPLTASQASTLSKPGKASRFGKAMSGLKNAASRLVDGKEARALSKQRQKETHEVRQVQDLFARQQMEVRNDIKAIGVARSLGYAQTVKESVQQARPIVNAAKHLRRPQRTQQVLEAMKAGQAASTPPAGSGETSGMPTTVHYAAVGRGVNEQQLEASPDDPRIGSLGWYLKTTPP
ncbi:MAG: hypothetical protein JF606_27815 [Burkholderiales bacterium]|nr:hypothetical protein [Burkholderiales bacterium]